MGVRLRLTILLQHSQWASQISTPNVLTMDNYRLRCPETLNPKAVFVSFNDFGLGLIQVCFDLKDKFEDNFDSDTEQHSGEREGRERTISQRGPPTIAAQRKKRKRTCHTVGHYKR